MQISWSSFHNKYSESEVKSYVPSDAGVYILWVKLKDGKWRCFYVGQAKDLETRLLDHLGDSEENECLSESVAKFVCGFEFAKVNLQKDRDGIEKFLFDHYNPECNIVDPGGTPICVNLP